MKPYYEDEFSTIYHGDCREILPAVVADCFITDPPYGVGLVGRTTKDSFRPGSYDEGYEDTEENVRDICVPIVQSMIDRFGRGAVTPGVKCAQIYPRANDIGAIYLPAGAARTSWGFSSIMPILFYGKDPFLQDGKGGRLNGYSFTGRSEDNGHPCPKPVDVMKWLCRRVARQGETIVDPFCGSGTTLRAAKDTGRKAIGIERVERYCQIAAERLSQNVLDLR